MKVQVLVRLKQGVLDVQGKAIEGHLQGDKVSHVRVGKLIELDVDEKDSSQAKRTVQELCERLLVNPIIETFEIREIASEER
jgi:phosphoribosylformylglycinamidine synthase subunit PurS